MKNGEEVAIKRVDAHRAKFEQEAQILESIKHENIVRFFHITERSALLYVIMELCKDNMNEFLKSRPISISSKEMSKYMCHIAKGLHYLHAEKRIVHRDIKPKNLLVTKVQEQWTVKLSDFGLSKDLSENESSVSATVGVGSPAWQAPEVLNGSRKIPYGFRSDIFSAGLVYMGIITRQQGEDIQPLTGTFCYNLSYKENRSS